MLLCWCCCIGVVVLLLLVGGVGGCGDGVVLDVCGGGRICFCFGVLIVSDELREQSSWDRSWLFAQYQFSRLHSMFLQIALG